MRIITILTYIGLNTFFNLTKECTAQNIFPAYQKSFGGTGIDKLTYSKLVGPNKILSVGVTNSSDGDIANQIGGGDAWLLYTDTFGNIIASQEIGGSLGDAAISFDTTIDSGLIIGATSASNDLGVSGNHGMTDYWITKLDSMGNIQWQKCFGGSQIEELVAIKQFRDSSFIIVGNTDSNDGDVVGQHSCAGCYTDIWVLRLNWNGNIIWQKCLGSGFMEFASPGGLAITNQNELLILGAAVIDGGDVSGSHGGFDFWILKLDSTGNIVNQKCFGGSHDESAITVKYNNEDEIYLIGSSTIPDGDVTINHGGSDVWILKIDHNFNIIWQNSYGGTADDQGKSGCFSKKNNLVFLSETYSNDGQISSNHGMRDYWFCRLDSSGNISFQSTYGGTLTDFPENIENFGDDKYILTGYSESFDGDLTYNHGGLNCSSFNCVDGWLLVLQNDLIGGISNINHSQSIEIYPNPNFGRMTLKNNTYSNKIRIYNFLGVLLNTIFINAFSEVQLSIANVPGIYFIADEFENKIKIIVQ